MELPDKTKIWQNTKCCSLASLTDRKMGKRRRHAELEEPPRFGYDGYSPSRAGEEVAKVDLGTLTPEKFFDEFIARRRPAIIEGTPDINLTPGHLTKHVGDAVVSVERRSTLSEGYGKGSRVEMTMADFVKNLASDKLYLTSQDTDGELFVSPVRELHGRGDIPLRPSLVSSLVPANISLWLGSSASSASSSGLHHDYHDNLYVLLSGRKSFKLYSPRYAREMQTHGKIGRVHGNGQISYVGHERHADGSTERERRRLEAKAKVAEAGRRLQALEEVDGAEPSALAAAEEDLERALDLELSMEEEEEEEGFSGVEATTMDGSCPRNFSSLSEERQRSLKDSCKAVEANIGAGEMLYLPCGWFHNVFSRNTESGYHLALVSGCRLAGRPHLNSRSMLTTFSSPSRLSCVELLDVSPRWRLLV